jgi:two-component system, OmpR family, alkaline phosphatase synthesis response regulator PhoP
MYFMQKPKLVLIEDEEDIAALIKFQADISGYKLHAEVDGLNGLRAVEREKPDLVILDIMLPGQSGLDVCRKMKSNPELKDIPVIIISAKSEELDVILGLELGADDYVSKPFSPKVLFSRVRAVLRRGKEAPDKAKKAQQVITFGPFTMEVDRYQVRKKDKVITLTLSEFGILKRLALHSGKVLTRNQLLDDIQNSDAFVVDRNIDVHIASLRKKLGPNFNWIETVRGVGYRFVEEEQ